MDRKIRSPLTLAIIIIALFIAGLVVVNSDNPTGYATVFSRYELEPGIQEVEFDTGTTPPLFDVRFFAAGQPDIAILSIEEFDGTPIIEFDPPLTPTDMTKFFTDNDNWIPSVSSSIARFTIFSGGTKIVILGAGFRPTLNPLPSSPLSPVVLR